MVNIPAQLDRIFCAPTKPWWVRARVETPCFVTIQVRHDMSAARYGCFNSWIHVVFSVYALTTRFYFVTLKQDMEPELEMMIGMKNRTASMKHSCRWIMPVLDRSATMTCTIVWYAPCQRASTWCPWWIVATAERSWIFLTHTGPMERAAIMECPMIPTSWSIAVRQEWAEEVWDMLPSSLVFVLPLPLSLPCQLCLLKEWRSWQ